MLEVTVILSLLAAVWAGVYLLRISPVLGCLIVILTSATFGIQFTHFDLGATQLSIDRIALIAVLAAYVVQRGLGRTEPKPLGRVDWLLLSLLGLIAYS